MEIDDGTARLIMAIAKSKAVALLNNSRDRELIDDAAGHATLAMTKFAMTHKITVVNIAMLSVIAKRRVLDYLKSRNREQIKTNRWVARAIDKGKVLGIYTDTPQVEED